MQHVTCDVRFTFSHTSHPAESRLEDLVSGQTENPTFSWSITSCPPQDRPHYFLLPGNMSFIRERILVTQPQLHEGGLSVIVIVLGEQ